jgi:NAD-dependent dihydropyrimidine dehydrogenase PreA subunit
MKAFRHFEGVTTLAYDRSRCSGCRTCTLVCPHAVFILADRKAEVVDRDGCMECGACALNCPEGAITVTPGVGCAAYIIQSWIVGKEKASCGPGCC